MSIKSATGYLTVFDDTDILAVMPKKRRKKLFNIEPLTAARLKLGMTRSKLAALCDLHYSTVSRLESGEHENPETIRRVARKLGVSMARVILSKRQRQAIPPPEVPDLEPVLT